jgi:hypothetical protein
VLTDIVDGNNVRMIKGGGRTRFLLEASKTIGVPGKRRRQNLNRDITIEARVVGTIDLAHTACAERSGYFVRADPRAGG